MQQRRAPFYLRRTNEAMVYFATRQLDGSWAAEPIFTKRIPGTVAFHLDGNEFAASPLRGRGFEPART